MGAAALNLQYTKVLGINSTLFAREVKALE
jgi:hypothetical protein